MRRAILVLWLVLVPIAARAQLQGDPVVDDERRAADRRHPSAYQTITTGDADASTVVAGDLFDASRVAFQAGAVASPDTTIPRRRGSMVGYIDDAVVSSKVRLRFEAALHDRAPDRAEFFYAKCGCYQDLPKNNGAYDPDAPGPGPGAANALNFQQLYVLAEYAFTGRASVFGEIPTRWIQPQSFVPGTGGTFPSQAGISDVQAGVKLAVVSTSEQVVTVQLRAFLPTGNASNGLGTGHWSVEPELLLHQRVSDRLVIESQVGDWHPVGGSAGVPITGGASFAGDVFLYGVGPSYELYRTDRIRFAPVVELVGWRVLGGFQTGNLPPSDASGTNIVNVKIGARLAWANQSSFYAGYGHALTSASWYEDLVRFEYRYSF
jgi:hypothetical protein